MPKVTLPDNLSFNVVLGTGHIFLSKTLFIMPAIDSFVHLRYFFGRLLLSLGFGAPFRRLLLRFPAMTLLSASGVLTSIRKFPFIEGYYGGRK